jgi:hypothetical protein
MENEFYLRMKSILLKSRGPEAQSAAQELSQSGELTGLRMHVRVPSVPFPRETKTMRRTLAVVVTTFALGALAVPSFAAAGCMGHQSASTVASAEQTSKPVQQTQVPTEQAK